MTAIKAKTYKTHDYTESRWGHSVILHKKHDDKGLTWSVSGFGRNVDRGDFMILANGTGTTRYRVEEIEYYLDPKDMWRGVISFAPR